MLDSAGIDANTLLNVTAGGNGGISAGDVESDENGRSSFRSYFDVFSEADNSGGPYTGWADEAHGTASNLMKRTITRFCASA